MSFEERKAIYDLFCETTNFYKDKVNTTIITSNRKLSKEQVYMVFVNEEYGRIIPLKRLGTLYGLNGSKALNCILQGKSYKDYALSYKNITEDEK
jgi:hypothetical protein